MRKTIPLKGKIDYNRKHDLTIEEIKASPVFASLNDHQIEEVRSTFIKMCQIFLESVDNQYIDVDLFTNNSHIAGGKVIELHSLNKKAA